MSKLPRESESLLQPTVGEDTDEKPREKIKDKPPGNIQKPPMERSEWGIRQFIGLPLAFICVIVFGFAPILPPEDKPAQQCLGVLLCAAILWASEAVPLFITAMLIPVLVVWFAVQLDSDGDRVARKSASGEIISSMLSSTICLALAGFTMTAALKKCGLDAMIANVTLSKAAKLGNFPFLLILSILCILMSAVVSNVTAPVLVLGFLEPYFDKLPARSPLKRCIATVVMIASNVGGMTTPISSPQNIVSMNEMTKAGLNINFGSFCICGILSALLCGGIGLVVDRFVFFNAGENRNMVQITTIIPMLETGASSSRRHRHRQEQGERQTLESDTVTHNNYNNIIESSSNVQNNESSSSALLAKGTSKEEDGESRVSFLEENKASANKGHGRAEGNTNTEEQSLIGAETASTPGSQEWTTDGTEGDGDKSEKETKKPGQKLTDKQYRKSMIIITSILSISALVLWIVVGFFESKMGDNGIISLFILFLFYATGVMLQKDFKDSIPWNVIFLLMGGNALGHAVQSSHLLDLITDLLNSMEGISEYAIVLVLLLIMGVVATFVSHTVSSIILMPIIINFCTSMAYTDTTAVAMTLALMCSGAMGLPVSSFPNTTMSGIIDKDGSKLVNINTIVLIGGTMTLLNYIVLGTVCYFLISVIV